MSTFDPWKEVSNSARISIHIFSCLDGELTVFIRRHIYVICVIVFCYPLKYGLHAPLCSSSVCQLCLSAGWRQVAYSCIMKTQKSEAVGLKTKTVTWKTLWRTCRAESDGNSLWYTFIYAFKSVISYWNKDKNLLNFPVSHSRADAVFASIWIFINSCC